MRKMQKLAFSRELFYHHNKEFLRQNALTLTTRKMIFALSTICLFRLMRENTDVRFWLL